MPKDYNLRRQNVNADRSAYAVQNTFVFTEKDLPGYKDKMNRFYNENQPYGRSYLYEQTKRDAKKKERKKKWEPYVRKTVPSMSKTDWIFAMNEAYSFSQDKRLSLLEFTMNSTVFLLKMKNTKD